MVTSSVSEASIAAESETALKFVCSQTALSQQLASVGRAVASRPSLPVLANVLLEVDPETSRVALTAFDLNLGIRSEFEAQVMQGGKTTLPARLLNDIVSRLPNGEVTLEQENPQGSMHLSSGSGRYQVRGMAAEDFPALPEIVAADRLELSVESLLQGISQTLFAASSDETKQVLTGVHVKLLVEEEPILEFAATDGHRLATVKVPLNLSEDGPALQPPNGQLNFTIPARALRELERILGNQPEATLTLQFNSSQVQFGLERHLITSRLLDGQYPDYHRLMPSEFQRQVTVERKPLIEVLERIAVFAAQKNDIVKFRFSEADQTLTISTEAPDVGSGEEFLPVQLSGEDLEIAFNVKYLLDALKVINTQDVKIFLNGQAQPAVWQPVGAMQLRYLVMPVQIRNT
ncbi:MAG: DNA polymerase III subunit beta [Synechococcaceae cyanobacterium SM2_3_1]|nr:DNA polymerase III subunit beta [Synechococcaceae cyanobacterium SM2_3_1]